MIFFVGIALKQITLFADSWISRRRRKRREKKLEKKNLNDAWRNVRKFVTAYDSFVINSSLISFWMFRWTFFFGGILFRVHKILSMISHGFFLTFPRKWWISPCLLFMYHVDKRERTFNDFCHLLHRETCVGNKLKPNTLLIFFENSLLGFPLAGSFSIHTKQE